MDASIVVAVITSVATILTVIISNSKTHSEMNAKLDKNLAIQETKLDALTNEVQRHNSFATRMPVIEEQIKVINNRLKDLERGKGA